MTEELNENSEQVEQTEEQTVQSVEECVNEAVIEEADNNFTVENAKVDSAEESKKEIRVDWSKPYEQMTIEELQQGILEKMAKNGPVTDRMYRDVMENVYHNSLVNWIQSFR